MKKADAQKMVVRPVRIPKRLDDEIYEAAEKLGIQPSVLYRNLLLSALEDYRFLHKLGLMRAASLVQGAKARFRDSIVDTAGEDYERLVE